MTEAPPAAARDRALEIWFQDEPRSGQKGALTHIWARLGSRPPGPRHSRYELRMGAYIFAAVCPQRATGAALVRPYANTEAMNLQLEEISRSVARGAPVCLPRSASELNPTEKIWE